MLSPPSPILLPVLALALAACGGSEFSASGGGLDTAAGGTDGRSTGGARSSGGSSGGTGTAAGGRRGSGGSGGNGGDGVVGPEGGTVTPSEGGLGSDGSTASDGSSAGGAGAGGAGAGGAPTCSDPPTWYPDGDQDGYGRSTGTVVGCDPPGNGPWARIGGDCNDDEDAVHPGQMEYVAEPYFTPGGAQSFDYNCSGAEEPFPDHVVAPTCNTLLTCSGGGYVKTARVGTGVHAYCGSHNLQRCAWAGLVCAAQNAGEDAVGFRCR